MTSGRFAITYTVKNEAALLPSSIAYHAAAGCSRFYVFWDGTTDAGPDLLRDRDDVVAQDSVSPDLLPAAGVLSIDASRWAHDSRVRQRVNTAYAATLAAREGIEWLLFIDADELVLGDPGDRGVARIDHMLARVAEDVDQVLAPNVEVVPTGAVVAFPFRDCTIFLARRPIARAIGRAGRRTLLRIFRSDRLAAWFDYLFYKMVSLGRLPRAMRDPWSGRFVPRGWFLGYHSYKPFVRAARAGSFDFAVHRWTASARGRPRSIRAGLVLHYDLFSVDHYARKFRQRQPRPGEPFSTRAFLSRVATTLGDDDLRAFFERNIAMADEEVARLIRAGLMIDIQGPAAFFASGPIPPADRPMPQPAPWRSPEH